MMKMMIWVGLKSNIPVYSHDVLYNRNWCIEYAHSDMDFPNPNLFMSLFTLNLAGEVIMVDTIQQEVITTEQAQNAELELEYAAKEATPGKRLLLKVYVKLFFIQFIELGLLAHRPTTLHSFPCDDDKLLSCNYSFLIISQCV